MALIDANIPLLFSKKQLKKWESEINFKDNTLTIGKTNEKFRLKETKGGHLALPLSKVPEDDKEELVKKILLVQNNKSHQMRDLKRIHKIFGNPRI